MQKRMLPGILLLFMCGNIFSTDPESPQSTAQTQLIQQKRSAWQRTKRKALVAWLAIAAVSSGFATLNPPEDPDALLACNAISFATSITAFLAMALDNP